MFILPGYIINEKMHEYDGMVIYRGYCVLLVGTYRDNEVVAKHPLSATLEKIRNDGTTVRQIYLDRFPYV